MTQFAVTDSGATEHPGYAIAHPVRAFFYPERVENDTISRVSFVDTQTLTFERIQYEDYPCLKLAMGGSRKGGDISGSPVRGG